MNHSSGEEDNLKQTMLLAGSAVSAAGKMSDIERYKQAQVSRENQQMIIYIVVACVIGLAWFLGSLHFSFVWVFLLIMLVFVMWWGKVMRLTEGHIRHAELMVHRKRALQHNETAEWLNFIINRWWVFSSPTISDLIKKNLDPILNDIKPSFLDNVELSEFTLGESTPFIKFVRVFELSGARKAASWMSISQPPPGLPQFAKYQVILEVEMGLQCEDFKMIFQTRFGGKRMGKNMAVCVEKLNISGKLQMILHMSMDTAFPHVSSVTFSFIEKPEVWFSVNVLKAVQVMEIPILKSWIHSLVMDALTEALVDPGKVDLKFEISGPSYAPSSSRSKTQASGVLTVSLSGENAKSNSLIEDIRYCALKVNEQKEHTHMTHGSVSWQDACSFLIEDIKKDKLVIKSKSKRFLSTYTLAQFELPLSNFPFEIQKSIETSVEKKISKWDVGGVVKLDLLLQYTPLGSIDMDYLQTQPIGAIDSVSGVMHVCVHRANNLMALDRNGYSDPYCIVFNNGKKVKTTHYVSRTRNPQWDVSMEFFVGDFTKSMLSFIVYDWDGYNASEDDFLGSGYLMLSKDEPMVIRKTLTLGYNMVNHGLVENSKLGSLVITAIFRPVSSVCKSDKWSGRARSVSAQDYHSDRGNRHSSKGFMNSAKSMFTREQKKHMETMGVGGILSMGYGVLELCIIRARDLVPMDSNGFSDPFCEVKISNERKFTTSVKKKTLNPTWEECVTLQLPNNNETLEIICWDRDMFFQKDFLGSLTFSIEDLKRLSHEDSPQWFQLKRIKSGEIMLQFKVISEEVALNPLLDEDLVTPPVFSDSDSAIATSPTSPHDMPSTVDSEKVHAEETKAVTSMTPIQESKSYVPRMEATESASVKLDETGSKVTSDVLKEEKQTERNSYDYSSLKPISRKKKMGDKLKRSASDVNVHLSSLRNRIFRTPSMSRDINQNKSKERLSHADGDSTSSIAGSYSDLGAAGTPTGSQTLTDKYFSVWGKVLQAKGFKNVRGNIYCKVRLDNRTSDQRVKKFSQGHEIAKSGTHKASDTVVLNLEFQLDKGKGVNKEALLIIDFKSSRKEHIANKGFTLRYILDEGTEASRWLSLGNDIEVELCLAQGSLHHHAPAPQKTGSLNRNSLPVSETDL